MYTLEKFKKNKLSLIVYQNQRRIFSSNASELKPLIRFLRINSKAKKVIIFDKLIGRAAALLITLIKPSAVYTPLISDGGKEVFKQNKINYYHIKMVSHLMEYGSKEMCQWEKISVNKTALELYKVVKSGNIG